MLLFLVNKLNNTILLNIDQPYFILALYIYKKNISKNVIKNVSKDISKNVTTVTSSATSKREIMDQLSEVRREAEKAKLMNQTCRKLSDQIRTLEAEHQTVQDELNRYQTRNDQLIKQNKVQFGN